LYSESQPEKEIGSSSVRVCVCVSFQFVPVCRDHCGSNLGKRSRKWKRATPTGGGDGDRDTNEG